MNAHDGYRHEKAMRRLGDLKPKQLNKLKGYFTCGFDACTNKNGIIQAMRSQLYSWHNFSADPDAEELAREAEEAIIRISEGG